MDGKNGDRRQEFRGTPSSPGGFSSARRSVSPDSFRTSNAVSVENAAGKSLHSLDQSMALRIREGLAELSARVPSSPMSPEEWTAAKAEAQRAAGDLSPGASLGALIGSRLANGLRLPTQAVHRGAAINPSGPSVS